MKTVEMHWDLLLYFQVYHSGLAQLNLECRFQRNSHKYIVVEEVEKKDTCVQRCFSSKNRIFLQGICQNSYGTT